MRSIDSTKLPDQEYDAEETARRRDAVLKIMVNTPPRPHVTRHPVQPKKQNPSGAGRTLKASGPRRKPSSAV